MSWEAVKTKDFQWEFSAMIISYRSIIKFTSIACPFSFSPKNVVKYIIYSGIWQLDQHGESSLLMLGGLNQILPGNKMSWEQKRLSSHLKSASEWSYTYTFSTLNRYLEWDCTGMLERQSLKLGNKNPHFTFHFTFYHGIPRFFSFAMPHLLHNNLPVHSMYLYLQKVWTQWSRRPK